MYKKSHTATHSKASFAITPFLFMPVLLYPPFLLTDKITASLRVSSFVLLIMYLFLATKHISKNDVITFMFLLILSASFVSINYADLDGLRTVGSTMLTLVFAWALSRYVKTSERNKENFIKFYTKLFIWIPVCSLLSVIFLFIFGELNLFNIGNGGHDTYLFTPFGALLAKDFAEIGAGVVYRSFSFFCEPVYLAFFCAVNIFLVAPYFKERSRFFLAANVIGGILTFSYLFFVVSFFLFFSKKIASLSFKANLYLLFLVSLIIISSQMDLFSSSSLGDRINRMNLFFMAMEDTNIFQFMFGRGFAQETGFDRGFSAGLFTTIYEVGIVNLVVIMLFVNALLNKKFYVFLLFFVALLVFEPIKLPLFWVLVVVLSIFEHPQKNLLVKAEQIFVPIP